jgi:hypothetical protein
MPIEKEFKYQNEADFTSHFLVPLLRRLGFSVVVDYHGVREFGKDLVFGEIDRFGEVAYHGLQIKYVDSISQSESEGLIEDAKQAFRHPFRHPSTGEEHRISMFIIANAGSIAQNARDNCFAELKLPHGGHIRMFEGKVLLSLDRWATITRVENIGEILEGLLIELNFNKYFIQIAKPWVKEYIQNQRGIIPIERLRSGAVSHYIQKPLFAKIIDTQMFDRFLLDIEKINNSLDAMSTSLTVNNSLSLANEISGILIVTDVHCASLYNLLIKIQSDLGPLAAI